LGTGTVDQLTAYSDADWAGCPDTHRSTSSFCVYLGDMVSWSSKRQMMVSRSSAKVEYRAVAHVVAECCWLHQLLQELHIHIPLATVVYCDNVSAVMYCPPPPHKAHRDRHPLRPRKGCSRTVPSASCPLRTSVRRHHDQGSTCPALH
jgi:hypothetical protein